MNHIAKLARLLAIAGLIITARSANSLADDPANQPKPAEAAPAGPIPWPAGLDEAKRRALAENRPLLVRVGASWCGPCQKLDREIEAAEVQDELRRWTVVYVDSDANPEEALQMGVGPIPALRVVSLRGKVVASQDGYMGAQDLVSWLRTSFDAAAAEVDPLLTAEGPPDDAAVGKLIDMFQRPEASSREAAIRRLMPHPQTAAGKTVEAFSGGRLTTRLAALELLREWKAPVTDLDPWRPETITLERQAALKKWAVAAAPAAAARPTVLTPAAADDARGDLIRLGQLPDAEADALAERLVRLGPALAPLVAAQLKAATTDQARQRFLAMRYRLVASDALALSWPGGLSRLASIDANVRHRAAEDLVKRAGEADEPLLVELFSDPDPLVREINLRGLLAVGGAGASDALVKLLDDPDANVRAAVLKELAEHPAPALVPKIAKYVAGEKDPDLLVHAIRFLRETSGNAAAECLIGLLKHESWQVRSEAAAALSKRSDRSDTESQADALAALIVLLDDPDPFVISRAMEGLAGADLPAAVEPLVHAAKAHPELAADAIKVLVNGQNTRAKAVPVLRKFAADKSPDVRAAAVRGLVEAAPDECDHELLAALNDDESVVRRAAAESLWHYFEQAGPNRRRYNYGESRPARPFVYELDENSTPLDFLIQRALAEIGPEEADMLAYRAGKDRPEWMAGLIGPLTKMLTASASDERLAAALALVPLAHEDQALPVLRKLVADEPARRIAVAAALPWLPCQKRLALFNELVALKLDDNQLARVAYELGQIKNPSMAAALWGLLERVDRENRNGEVAAEIYQILQEVYKSPTDNLRINGAVIAPTVDVAGTQVATAAVAKLDELHQRAGHGSLSQRIVALALLLSNTPEDVPALATAMIDDPKLPGPQRQQALRMLLLAEPEGQGEKAAVARAIGKDAALRRLALIYLAQGRGALVSVKGDPFYIYDVKGFDRSSVFRGGESPQAIEVTAPAGLTADSVRPLLHDADPEVAAAAGYLLATLGESDGLEPLIKFWRTTGGKDQAWNRLVYRAVSALDDAGHVPLLAEIYKQKEELDMKDFYWTIRAMKGPAIMELRKRIRDEVGVENLR